MSSVFVSRNIWPELTRAVHGSEERCAAAVAYFGAGASRLLPLPKGSRLVVDASERAVTSGQTCPADLLKLQGRGVTVYSVPNLHAKVVVVGPAAYVGSANVSKHSASQLIEAVVRTTSPGAVRAAWKFVLEQCLHELTPRLLKQLARQYRPPRFPGGRWVKREGRGTSRRPELPRVHLARLVLEDWPTRDQTLHDVALSVAKKRRQDPRSFKLDSFRWSGECPYNRGDVVVMVTDEGPGKVLVSPPGNVLHVRPRREGSRRVSFVFVEHPARRRRTVAALARALGRGSLTRLRRGGRIQNVSFAQALLNEWAL